MPKQLRPISTVLPQGVFNPSREDTTTAPGDSIITFYGDLYGLRICERQYDNNLVIQEISEDDDYWETNDRDRYSYYDGAWLMDKLRLYAAAHEWLDENAIQDPQHGTWQLK